MNNADAILDFHRVATSGMRCLVLMVLLLGLLSNHTSAQDQSCPVTELILSLKNQDPSVRRLAAEALGRCRGKEAKDAVAALIAALNDPVDMVRYQIFGAFRDISIEEKDVVTALIATLKEKDPVVRGNAAEALGVLGKEKRRPKTMPAALDLIHTLENQAVPALVAALNDPEPHVRRNAAAALGQMPSRDKRGMGVTEAVSALIIILKDQDPGVRRSAADALAELGKEAKDAVTALITALKDPDNMVRRSAVVALGNIGSEGKDAVPALIAALEQDNYVRSNAAQALGQIGLEARSSLPALIIALKDQDSYVQSQAAEALGLLANALFDSRSTEALPQLKRAYDAMKDHPDEQVKQQAILVKRAIDFLESLWWGQLKSRAQKLVGDHYIVAGFVLTYLLLQCFWALCFWLRPLLLLQANTTLDKLGSYKIDKFDKPLSVSLLLIFPWFRYHPRLLDAWVNKYLDAAKAIFTANLTVKQHKVYVPTPAILNDQLCDSLTAAQLQPIFEKSKATLLLTGEGGAGKTSLACQTGFWAMKEKPEQRLCKAHPMIPVLIEGNLKARDDKKNSFFIALRKHLSDLIGDTEPMLDELANQLLKKSRVLVIVDSFSELDDATQNSIRQAQDDFLVGALIVTTRNKEEVLGGTAKTIINPPRLKGKVLTSFLQNYLCQRLERELSEQEDLELFAGCKRLSEIIGEREITVLIAKMYAEQMLAAKLKLEDEAQPQNLFDLMKSYINTVNDKIKADLRDTNTVLGAAKIVARESLRTFSPKYARIDDVLKSLAASQIPSDLLKYLREKVSLLQISSTGDEVKFFLDPLAECLAAIYLLEQNKNEDDRWREFLDEAKVRTDTQGTTKGFLEIVLHCMESKGAEFRVPEWAQNELALLVGRDPEAVKAAQLKQRIQRLTENLNLPDVEDRIAAMKALRNIGGQAITAIPKLTQFINDRDRNIRIHAATAVFSIDPSAYPDITVLIEALETGETENRIKAASALGNVSDAARAIDGLEGVLFSAKDVTPDLYCQVASSLGKFGKKAIETKYRLMRLLEHKEERVRHAAASALGNIGGDDEEVVDRLVETIIREEDVDVCEEATYALARGQSDLAFDALSKLFKSSDEFQRRCALDGLAYFGSRGSAMIIQGLSDPNAEVREAAVSALSWMGSEALPLLTQALEDEDDKVRYSAVRELRKLGQASIPSITTN